MRILARARSFVRNLVRRKQTEASLDAELASFLEMRTAEKIAAGIEPAAALRAARLELGGIEQVKETVREVRAGAVIDTLFRDFQSGIRLLVRNPGFTVAAVLALALGIGASAAIFSVVNAVLLRPLPYGHPERLAVVLHHGRNPVSPANYLDWRRENDVFERMGAAEIWTPNLAGGARAESIRGLRVTSDVFALLQVPPLLGRNFVSQEEVPGRDHEVILGYGIWQRRFGGDREILGRSILLNGEPHTVVGVMPASFAFPPFWATGADLWTPLALGPRSASREGNSLRVFARRKPGVSLKQASAAIAGITARLERQFPGTNRDVQVRSLHETVVGNVRPALLVLLAAVGFVLLIACANVAHMLLARAAARQKEIAIRTALGASRSRTIRQLLTESLVLAGAGGLAGLLLAVAGVRALVALGPSDLPRVETIALDGWVLAFTVGVSLLTGLAFGLTPALQSCRRDLVVALREGERGSTTGRGQGRSRLRSLLVGSEFSLALMLAIGAGLLIRSFFALSAIDPGFDPKNVLTMIVSVAGTSEEDPARRQNFYTALLARVRALPGVRSCSAINHLPLAGDIWGFPFAVEGRPRPKPGEGPSATYRVVFPDYFATMRIPILRGRDVSPRDRADSAGVVVVNQRLAQQHWPGENPIGKRISLDDHPLVWRTVVGVVRNTVREEWAAPAEDEVYLPIFQTPMYIQETGSHATYMTLVIRSAGEPSRLAGPVRGAIAAIDPNLAVSEVQTMDDVVSRANAQPRFYLLLLSAFAFVALALAGIGVYGVMSYTVSRRIHEIGIRMALGADRRDLVRLVVREGMRVAALGAAIGLVGAIALTRLMSSLLYGVRSTDPVTFAAVALLVGAIALAASWIPARRATRIDPLAALRHE